PLAKWERPHSSAFDAMPKAAPTHASVPVWEIGAVGLGAAGATIAASGRAGRPEGDGRSGTSGGGDVRFSVGAPADGTSADRSGGGGVAGITVAAGASDGHATSEAIMTKADSRRVTTSSPRPWPACSAGWAAL